MTDTTQSRVDDLAKEWQEIQREKAVLSEREKVLTEEIDLAAGLYDKRRGTVNCPGNELTIKVLRRENVRYDKTDNGHNPLLVALQKNPKLEDYVTLSVREKGTLLSKLFDKHESELTEDERDIYLSLVGYRICEAGKPQIKVDVRKS